MASNNWRKYSTRMLKDIIDDPYHRSRHGEGKDYGPFIEEIKTEYLTRMSREQEKKTKRAIKQLPSVEEFLITEIKTLRARVLELESENEYMKQELRWMEKYFPDVINQPPF